MNPDPIAIEAYMAGYNHDRRIRAEKVARSRAAQPKRKDNRRARPNGAR